MEKHSTICLLGCDTDIGIIAALRSLGFDVIQLPRDVRLPAPISSHADTLVFSHGGKVFCSEDYYNIPDVRKAFEALAKYGYNIITSRTRVFDSYPHDIAFNVFVCKHTIFGNLSYTADEICDYAASIGLKKQMLKQGYAKCSSLVLGDNAIVSADNGIINAAKELDIPNLKIQNSPNAVSLSGYDYGFIGGACGVFNGTVYFTGDIYLHPNGKELAAFCSRFGFSVCSLTKNKLCDIGGIMFFPMRAHQIQS